MMNSNGNQNIPQVLDWETALKEFDNDRDFLIQLIKNFCIRYADWKIEFENLMEQEKWEELRRAVHKLKGASGNLYAPSLYSTALKWEEDLLKGKTSENMLFMTLANKEVERLNSLISSI